jgi:hypothetical protein
LFAGYRVYPACIPIKLAAAKPQLLQFSRQGLHMRELRANLVGCLLFVARLRKWMTLFDTPSDLGKGSAAGAISRVGVHSSVDAGNHVFKSCTCIRVEDVKSRSIYTTAWRDSQYYQTCSYTAKSQRILQGYYMTRPTTNYLPDNLREVESQNARAV